MVFSTLVRGHANASHVPWTVISTEWKKSVVQQLCPQMANTARGQAASRTQVPKVSDPHPTKFRAQYQSINPPLSGEAGNRPPLGMTTLVRSLPVLLFAVLSAR